MAEGRAAGNIAPRWGRAQSLPIVAATGLWFGVVLAGSLDALAAPAVAAVLIIGGLPALAASSSLAARRGNRPLMSALSMLMVGGSFAVLGGGWQLIREARLARSPLLGLAGEPLTAVARVTGDPQAGPIGWTATAGLSLVVTSPSSMRALRLRDEVWVEGRGRAPGIRAGDRIEFQGAAAPPRGEFGTYLRRRGISATFSLSRILARAPPADPLTRAAGALRDALRSSLWRVFPPEDAGLVMGLALGDTSRLDPQVEESFRATGLSHLTAVSGENVAMFLAPLLGAATALGLGRRGRLLVGLSALCFFVVLTRAQPSVLRAGVMAGLTLLGVFLGRPRSAPSLLGGAVLLLLAVQPGLVYSTGFQLSVAASAGMALLSAPLAARMAWLPRGLALAVAATVGAQAGVTPLLLYRLQVVPTVSIPANLLAFPAVGPGMLLGLLSAGLGLAFRPLGLAAAGVARLPLGYLEWLAARLARAPLPAITSRGGLGMLTLSVASVAAAAAWLRSTRPLPRRVVVAALAFLPAFAWATAARAGPPSFLTVTFFDVGQGDSALVRSPGGAVLLIDGGQDSQQVSVKLAALGVRRIDVLVATHAHADHVGGLPAVLARFPVALVLDPACDDRSPPYASFLRAVRASGAPERHPPLGSTLTVGDVRLDVLGPERCFLGTGSDPNNDSLVLRLSLGRASVLMAGEAEEPSQTELLRRGSQLSAALLKVPHHGGATSLPAFFQAVQARLAVVSVGPNRYGHPSPVTLAELAAGRTRVVRTDRAGDVTVSFPPTGLAVSWTGAAQ